MLGGKVNARPSNKYAHRRIRLLVLNMVYGSSFIKNTYTIGNFIYNYIHTFIRFGWNHLLGKRLVLFADLLFTNAFYFTVLDFL